MHVWLFQSILDIDGGYPYQNGGVTHTKTLSNIQL